MNGELTRLVYDSSVREELRQRLTREASSKPAYDVEHGLERLRAALGGDHGAPSGDLAADLEESASEPPSARLSVSSYAVKGSVWKVASVVGLAGAAILCGVRAWAPATHVGRLETGGVAVASFAAPPRGASARAAEAAREGSPAAGDGSDEAENLALIRAALAADPRGALALSEDGNRRFSAGTLGEEREASAIRSLGALGRHGDARARAERFLSTYPKSPFADRVRASAKL